MRQFALLWIGFFLFQAVWQALRYQNSSAAVALAVLALTVGPLGLAWPRLMGPIYVGWMVLVFPIGWVVSHAVLAFLFYGLFTPLGLVFRWARRDVLVLRRPFSRATYWTAKPHVTDARRYFRQF